MIDLGRFAFEALRKDEEFISFTAGGVRMMQCKFWCFRRWWRIPRRKV